MTDWPPGDERQLVQRAQRGDSEAYGQLYERFAPRVFRFLWAHLDNRHDAEDLTEEVFLRTWRALPGYRLQETPFASFLFRVARNALNDLYRQRRRRGEAVSLDEAPAQIGQAEAASERLLDPAEALPAEQERQDLRRALASLREDYRLVLELRFWSDLTTDEIAQMLGRSRAAVRVLQYRALLALRKALAREEKG